jgi:hypothetical protein
MPMFFKPNRLSIKLHRGFFMIMSAAFEVANTKTAPEEHPMPETAAIAARTMGTCALHDRGIRVKPVFRSELDSLNA